MDTSATDWEAVRREPRQRVWDSQFPTFTEADAALAARTLDDIRERVARERSSAAA